MNYIGSLSNQGFTLIELMVVIVVMAIMASLVLINIGGVDQRKAMQAREVLILDLNRINREANDQARIFALNIESATDVAPFRYGVSEYMILSGQNSSPMPPPILAEDQKWQDYTGFKARTLPDQVSFNIQTQERQYENAHNQDLIQANAPKLIWFGNGEAKPVRIQFYFEQRPIGEEIEIDYLGKVNAS